MHTRLGVLAAAGLLASASAGINGAATGDQPAARTSPPGRSFTVAATGDILTEALVLDAARNAAAGTGRRYDFTPLLAPIGPILDAADLSICHMETPIGPPGAAAGKIGVAANRRSLIQAPYELAADIHTVGFDRCSTASNHSFDNGTAGIAGTLQALDAAGVGHVGTARSAAEASTTMFVVNGVRVAHLAYTNDTNTDVPPVPWLLQLRPTVASAAADVNAARAAGAEVVIVSVHVLAEMLPAPIAADRAFVTGLTAAAHVDLVIEHGPHVVQPLERVNGTWVYWSVGNLISGMGVPGRNQFSDPRALDGLLATADVEEGPPGTFTVSPLPVLLCNDAPSRVVHPAFATLADPALALDLRARIEACVARASAVVADLH